MHDELYNYDVVLSFAGEDRDFVDKVAKILTTNDIQIFYDKDKEVELWGKELPEELDLVFRKRGRFAVIFISKNYLEKIWPTLEKRSMLSRAMESHSEYILPARFDDTELPGLRPTIGYIDLRKQNPQSFAELIIRKIKKKKIIEAESAESKTTDYSIVQPMVGYDLAMNILTLCYKIRDEIKNCQHPFMSVAELSQRRNEGKKREGESSRDSDILDGWYATFKRYEKIIDIKNELDKLKIKAEILFGIESRKKIENLFYIIRSLGIAIQSYYEGKLHDIHQGNRDIINRNIINGINPFDYQEGEGNMDYNNDGGFEERFRLSVKNLTEYFRNILSELLKLIVG